MVRSSLIVICYASRLLGDLVLQALTSLEGGNLGGFDLHNFTSPRIASFTSGAFFNAESAKANQLHGIALRQSISDSAKHSINYPVVRSDRTDYYLHHLITGQESKLGTLFSLTTSDYEKPSRNIAIYGHHLSNSTAMFSTLMEYKKEDYWEKHQLIQVDSIYGKKTYRIFAVLNHTVSDWDASTASFKDDASFLKFVTRAREKAFYDTGITVSETDNIITLITCDRSFGGVQGRLLVMGVEQ